MSAERETTEVRARQATTQNDRVDDLAKGLAARKMSRGQALKWVLCGSGAAFLGGVLPLFTWLTGVSHAVQGQGGGKILTCEEQCSGAGPTGSPGNDMCVHCCKAPQDCPPIDDKGGSKGGGKKGGGKS